MLLLRFFSGRNFVQLVQQALDALAYMFAFLLESFYLLLYLGQLRRLFVEELLQRGRVLLGSGAGFALFLKHLDGAQDALFERAKIVGSHVQFSIVEAQGWTSEYLVLLGGNSSVLRKV